MTKKAINALGAALLINMSLFIWRGLYPDTDWAVLALIPLMVLLELSGILGDAA